VGDGHKCAVQNTEYFIHPITGNYSAISHIKTITATTTTKTKNKNKRRRKGKNNNNNKTHIHTIKALTNTQHKINQKCVKLYSMNYKKIKIK